MSYNLRTTVKTQVYFRPAKLHSQLRELALEQHTTMSALICRYCAEGLARDAAEQAHRAAAAVFPGAAAAIEPPPGG